MKKEPITFTKLETISSEVIFNVQTMESNIVGVRAFQPELHLGNPVLPIEFTKETGEKVLLGFSLDREKLRELLNQ